MNRQPPGMFPTWKAAGRYSWRILALVAIDCAIIFGAVVAVSFFVREVFR